MDSELECGGQTPLVPLCSESATVKVVEWKVEKLLSKSDINKYRLWLPMCFDKFIYPILEKKGIRAGDSFNLFDISNKVSYPVKLLKDKDKGCWILTSGWKEHFLRRLKLEPNQLVKFGSYDNKIYFFAPKEDESIQEHFAAANAILNCLCDHLGQHPKYEEAITWIKKKQSDWTPMPVDFPVQELILALKHTDSKLADIEADIKESIAGQDSKLLPVHVPKNLMEEFMRLAHTNTMKDVETIGILAGILKENIYHITTLLVPKQKGKSDSCETINEEKTFEILERKEVKPIGWIHTHPSHLCFMSSVDLHTQFSFQLLLPEAIGIVMAPTDIERPFGIYHLCDPVGTSVIWGCQLKGFHEHEEPSDGSSIYELCSHAFVTPVSEIDVVDIREKTVKI